MVDIYQEMGLEPMEQILLPPLEEKITVQQILYGDSWKKNWLKIWQKKWAEDWKEKEKQIEKGDNEAHSMFSAPVGLLDSLSTHTQPPFYLDFLKQGGHAMIIGAPQTGKTFFLESLLLHPE